MSRWDVFVWILAPGAVAASVAATAISARKQRWLWSAAGAVASAAAIWVMVSSWTASSESFADLGAAAAWLVFVAPLTILALIGAFMRTPRGGRDGVTGAH